MAPRFWCKSFDDGDLVLRQENDAASRGLFLSFNPAEFVSQVLMLNIKGLMLITTIILNNIFDSDLGDGDFVAFLLFFIKTFIISTI